MNLAKTKTLAALLLTTLLLSPLGASASVRHVWAVNDGEKVERDDLDNPNKNRGQRRGGSNQIVAFTPLVPPAAPGVNSSAW